jgi:catechol 2,3-dioxygenase-like lactoylglutathione lyase family enzyme
VSAPLRLDHVVVAASDWERSNRFYREVLGAEVAERGDGYVYRFGDQQLARSSATAPGERVEACTSVIRTGRCSS